jgi:hypothetical protein
MSQESGHIPEVIQDFDWKMDMIFFLDREKESSHHALGEDQESDLFCFFALDFRLGV